MCIFRPEANAARINSSARHLLMPEFPEDKFVEAVKRVVADNIDYVPPYGTGGSLYIRPVMFGITPQIGVSPSKEYMMIFIVTPVGAYYKGGLTPVEACISVDFDRAAPHGTGHIKAAGNYAAGMLSTKIAKEQHHCPVALFLDPATHTMVDEFGPWASPRRNFTVSSPAVLRNSPSATRRFPPSRTPSPRCLL